MLPMCVYVYIYICIYKCVYIYICMDLLQRTNYCGCLFQRRAASDKRAGKASLITRVTSTLKVRFHA